MGNVADLKRDCTALSKIVNSMKGGKTEWVVVCEAWKKLCPDTRSALDSCKGVTAWAMRCEAMAFTCLIKCVKQCFLR